MLAFGCGENKHKGTFYVDEKIIENMAAPTDTGNIVVSDEMLTKGLYNTGDTRRLAALMERAAKGEEITIAYIGGSITNGSLASPQETNCYAYLSTSWWRETFKDAKINYVNAGVGATDSYLGVHRAATDVLTYNPDLVIVEFSVNDGQSINQESYESLLRMLLNYETEPAVISLLLTTEGGWDYSTQHTQVAFRYKVPILSYKAMLDEGYASGSISWSDVGSSDGVHPINGGHSVIAYLLTSFYSNVLSEINDTVYDEYTVPDQKFTKCRYESAYIEYSDTFSDFEANGFEAGNVPSNLLNTNGWSTENGGSITFTVNTKSIGIAFFKTTDGKSGQYDVYVDDELITLLNGDFSGGWGNCVDVKEIIRFDEAGEHKVRLELNDESENTKFAVCALLLTN